MKTAGNSLNFQPSSPCVRVSEGVGSASRPETTCVWGIPPLDNQYGGYSGEMQPRSRMTFQRNRCPWS